MIHVSETSAAALETMDGLGKQQQEFMAKQPHQICSWKSTQQHLQLQTRLLRSLYCRSESNKARLQNEITLVRASNGLSPDPTRGE